MSKSPSLSTLDLPKYSRKSTNRKSVNFQASIYPFGIQSKIPTLTQLVGAFVGVVLGPRRPIDASEHVARYRGRFCFYFVTDRGGFRWPEIIDFVLRGVLMFGCTVTRFVIKCWNIGVIFNTGCLMLSRKH